MRTPALSKGEKRKREILENAIAIIASDGLDALTFEAIGQRLGIRKSHVAYHFPDKKDIVYEAVQFIVTVGVSIIQNHMQTKGESLRSYQEGNFLWLEKNPSHAPVFLLFFYFSSLDERYRKLYALIRANGQQRIKALLVDENVRVPTTHLGSLAVGIQNLITASLLETYTTTGSPQKIKAQLAEQIKKLIAGFE